MGTTASGLNFYPNQMETGIEEAVTQNLDGWGATSANALQLQDGAEKGRGKETDYFDLIDPIVNIDPSSGSDVISVTEFSTGLHRTIKVFHAAAIKWRKQDWLDRGMDSETGQRKFGSMYGQKLTQRYLNSIVAALAGAIPSATSTAALTVHDVSASTAFDYAVLNDALALLEDAGDNASTLVIRTIPLRNLGAEAYTKEQIAFQFGTTTIRGGAVPTVGMASVHSSIPALSEPTTSQADRWVTLALVPGAATLRTGPTQTQFGPILGDGATTLANQTELLKIQSEYEISIRGVAYKAASPESPTDADLADPANWEKAQSGEDARRGPGILIRTQ